jgi:hypothetical protein
MNQIKFGQPSINARPAKTHLVNQSIPLRDCLHTVSFGLRINGDTGSKCSAERCICNRKYGGSLHASIHVETGEAMSVADC